jgi:hypothetical protein
LFISGSEFAVYTFDIAARHGRRMSPMRTVYCALLAPLLLIAIDLGNAADARAHLVHGTQRLPVRQGFAQADRGMDLPKPAFARAQLLFLHTGRERLSLLRRRPRSERNGLALFRACLLWRCAHNGPLSHGSAGTEFRPCRRALSCPALCRASTSYGRQ